jgi:hypothetical protein
MKRRRERPGWAEMAGLAIGAVGAVVAILAFLVPLLTDSGPASGEPTPARLEVDSFSARDFNQGPHPNAHLEVILHNRGGTRAVIDGATIEVEDVYALERCASQNDLPLSDTYGLVLSHRPARRNLLLHDQVGADAVDRFALSLSTRLSNDSPGTYFLFRLHLKLKNDGPISPLVVGTALIALPTVPDQGEYFWTPTTVELLSSFQTEGRTVREFWGESMPCWRKNTKILRAAFSRASVRSGKLAAISGELITPSFSKLENRSDQS